MPIEIEFSFMTRGESTDQHMAARLKSFEAKHHILVRLHPMEWPSAWSDLVRMAINGRGPDVSEIGSTWVSDLSLMNVLAPFTKADLTALGGPAKFLGAAWNSGQMARAQGAPAEMWAVPFLADTRVVFYRREWLARTGADEAQAFATASQFRQTLAQLAASGHPVPWVMPTLPARPTVHAIASWIWGAGGDFLNVPARQVTFHLANARAGIQAYYELGQYLSPSARRLSEQESDGCFNQGQAAVTLSGPWLVPTLSPELRADVGAALPPGTPFLGGSHLVVWRHARHAQAAHDLVRYLTDEGFQAAFGRDSLLPVRLETLAQPHLQDDPLYRVLGEALRQGRPFPVFPLWGTIEDRLSDALSRIWTDVLSAPDVNLEACLSRHLDPLVRRLDITLQG